MKSETELAALTAETIRFLHADSTDLFSRIAMMAALNGAAALADAGDFERAARVVLAWKTGADRAANGGDAA